MKKILGLVVCIPVLLSAQNEEIKILNYNLMYYRASSAPCTQGASPTQRDQYLKDIVKYVDPDIFTVNEMGSNASNHAFVRDFVLNSDGVTKYASAQYSNNSFSSLTNMLYYDSNKLGLLGQTAITKDLSGNNLVRVIDVYHLYYKDALLGAGADTITFTVILAHLKAGTGSSNALERAEATEAVMDYLDNSLGENNVIFCGDLNLYTNAEPAFQDLVNYSTVSERFVDPLNQSGIWHDNNTYAGVHTQSTHSSGSGCFSGGGLDDRFDFFLVSDEIMNGSEGVSYQLNSYTTIGQDGNRFNQSVNAGTNSSVPSSIASTLFNFSDHLPILMKIGLRKANVSVAEDLNISRNITFNNPIHNELVVRVKLLNDQDRMVRLLNLAGQVVKEVKWEKGATEQYVDTSDLNHGVYLLNIRQGNGESLTKKLIKN